MGQVNTLLALRPGELLQRFGDGDIDEATDRQGRVAILLYSCGVRRQACQSLEEGGEVFG